MNFNTLYTIIALACFAVTFKRFEPTQSQLIKLTALKGKLWHQIYKLLSCSMCIGLWSTLIWTQDFGLACIVSVLATYIQYLTSKI